MEKMHASLDTIDDEEFGVESSVQFLISKRLQQDWKTNNGEKYSRTQKKTEPKIRLRSTLHWNQCFVGSTSDAGRKVQILKH